ncbi:MAG TPA: EAL domain-containing protein [Tepidisphaeraceae bacterium]|jgi:diguanylate cyclase (GGDEF)-like protein|nr:EAL domain-containing protein [Tepidisphaeraceae bacterium]
MIPAPLFDNEPERIGALNRYEVADAPPEIALDDIALLASRICQTPMAAISFVDQNRQWFKSQIGLPMSGTPRDIAFCGHAILQSELLVIPDARADGRFQDNPLVIGEPHIRFYAGAPLITPDGMALGSVCVMDTAARSLSAEQAEGLQALARQVTTLLELRRTQRQLAHAALHDALTGLPNRMLLTNRIEHCLARAKSRKGYLFAVLFLDLDRFKVINDSMDHSAGDKLLQKVAERLSGCVRSGDTIGRSGHTVAVARLGGDEFTVLLEDLRAGQNAADVAQRLLTELAKPMDIDGQEIVATASIGVVIGGAQAESATQLLRDADAAMYRAKGAGGNRYVMFDPAMHLAATERMQIENDLRNAVARGQLVLHYQPIVCMKTRKLLGFEALLRWNRDGKIFRPSQFIPVAEETGLIVPIGRWIITQACQQLAEWHKAVSSAPPLFMSINLSRRQFVDRELIPHLSQTLKETALEAKDLQLELTESIISNDAPAARMVLTRLKKLGVQLAVDDFGTGYSSLSCLHSFPLDVLKIDRAFVTSQRACSDTVAVLKAIVDLAHNLKMRVVAEGVETAEQAALLETVECNEGQGYFFAKPLNAQAATALLWGNTVLGEAA